MSRDMRNLGKAVAMLALGCASLVAHSTAIAQSAPTTGVLNVAARLESGCRVVGQSQATGVDFGDLDFATHPSLFKQQLTAQSQLSMSALQLRCVGVVSANVSVGVGMYATGNQRRLASGAQRVPYSLYADSAGLQPFDGSTPRSVAISATGALATVNLPVYGRVAPAVGGYSPGNYQDSVQITVTW